MNRSFRVLFFLVAISQLASPIFDLHLLHLISKPLIVISFSLFYFTSTNQVNKIFVAALFFCWLGDVFLLFDKVNELYFIAGLGSFLTAHVLLIVLYRQLRTDKGDGLSGPQKIRAAFPIILMGTGLITILYPSLGGLKVPVIIYALALTVMVLQSVFRYGFTSAKSFWNIFFGAMLFMISDSALAINKFLSPFSYAGVLVIATYIAALYFITVGVLAHSSPARKS